MGATPAVPTSGTAQALSPSGKVFARLTVQADLSNTGTIYVGSEGNPNIGLVAGSSITYHDVAPTDLFVLASASSQAVHWQGYGRHHTTEVPAS